MTEIKTVPTEIISKFKLDELNNKKLFVTSLYKYLDYKRDVAVKHLMSIDYCKNTFSELTLKNYLSNVAKYIATGIKAKTCPSYVYDMVDELRAKNYPKLRPSEADRKSSTGGRPCKSKTVAITESKPMQKQSTVVSILEDEIKALTEEQAKYVQLISDFEKKIKACTLTLEIMKERGV